jgi:hypothetical protein
MELFLYFIGLCGAFFLGRRFSKNVNLAPIVSEGNLNRASDRELILATFRRELANYMVWHDPNRFTSLYEKACAMELSIQTADKEMRKAQLTVITKKYPFYRDFDFVGTREHVLYADSLNSRVLEDVEDHYLKLVSFQALQRSLDDDWKFRTNTATGKDDLDHLVKYTKKIADTKFYRSFVAAKNEYFANCDSFRLSKPDSVSDYENRFFEVFRLPSMPDNKYGFHFKDTGEFGLYSSYYDDSKDKFYDNFVRTDRLFKASIYLDVIRVEDNSA